MERPVLFNFLCIRDAFKISLRCSVIYTKKITEEINLATPWQYIWQMKSNELLLKVKAFNKDDQIVYEHTHQSDSFGHFSLKFQTNKEQGKVKYIKLYEVSTRAGIHYYIGSYIPENIDFKTQRVIISDFDKTLVDTKYSTPREMYQSISSPIGSFPSINSSIDILIDRINQGYLPFILSASPHFYEKPIRDWLYAHKVYTNRIFLKDYRDAFSIFKGELSIKDLKAQGFYKLNSLVEIFLLTGAPKQIILMGDGFEADSIIYLALRAIITEKMDPLYIWNQVKKLDSFQLTRKQSALFLNKLYRLQALFKEHKAYMSIYIRSPKGRIKEIESRVLPCHFLEKQKGVINFFEA